MHLTDFARKVPDDVWTLFEPILPPVVWCGNGCPPYDNRECLHAVLYVLVMGMEGECCLRAFRPTKPCNDGSRAGWNWIPFGPPGDNWSNAMKPCRGSTGM